MGSVACPSPLQGPLNQHMSSRAIIVTPACVITTAGIIKCSFHSGCCHLLPPGPRPWVHWEEVQEGTVGHTVGLGDELCVLLFPFLQQGSSLVGFFFSFGFFDQ